MALRLPLVSWLSGGWNLFFVTVVFPCRACPSVQTARAAWRLKVARDWAANLEDWWRQHGPANLEYGLVAPAGVTVRGHGQHNAARAAALRRCSCSPAAVSRTLLQPTMCPSPLLFVAQQTMEFLDSADVPFSPPVLPKPEDQPQSQQAQPRQTSQAAPRDAPPADASLFIE